MASCLLYIKVTGAYMLNLMAFLGYIALAIFCLYLVFTCLALLPVPILVLWLMFG